MCLILVLSSLPSLLQLWCSSVGAANRRGAIQRDWWACRRLRSRCQQAHPAHPFHVPRTLRSAHGRWGHVCGNVTECTHTVALLRHSGVRVLSREVYFHFPKAGLDLRKTNCCMLSITWPRRGKCFVLATLCNIFVPIYVLPWLKFPVKKTSVACQPVICFAAVIH